MSATYRGIAVSPGIAIAAARVVPPDGSPAAPARGSLAFDGAAELAGFRAALEKAKLELAELRDRTAAELGALKAEIFAAHLSILKDPELASEVERGILEDHLSAAEAARAATDVFALLLAESGDPTFAARADDLRDLGRRLVRLLDGGADPLVLERRSVVVARELSPSDTARLDRALTAGFVVAGGSAVSHSSILARSLGIPAVAGAPDAVDAIRDGALVVVDGSSGLVTVDPDPAELELWRGKAAAWRARAELLEAFAGRPTRTGDGTKLALAANIAGTADLSDALARGAEGVGLFRTEFLYMGRADLPSEDEQYAVYRHVLERMGKRRVIVRTLDSGGDKEVPCLGMPREENPFLGVRAIRLCLERVDVFRVQLRALLRASAHGSLGIMFPMIATVEELRAAKALLAEERAALAASGAPLADTVETGVMIEIPAAALRAEVLARECDFFSIGSNDLTQYTMAADRMNPALARLSRPCHPAVLALIAMTADAAGRRGIPVGVCGEMAADPICAAALAGLGVTELSMGSASIPLVREALSRVDLPTAARLARAALEAETEPEARRILEGAFQ